MRRTGRSALQDLGVDSPPPRSGPAARECETQSGHNWRESCRRNAADGEPCIPAAGVQQLHQPLQLLCAASSSGAYACELASFDAIRVYLWLGIADPKTPGLKRCRWRIFRGWRTYLSKQSVPPLTVDSFGSVKESPRPLAFSAALFPRHLQALNRMERPNRVRRSARLKGGLGCSDGGFMGSRSTTIT